jgi:hypothetical protein
MCSAEYIYALLLFASLGHQDVQVGPRQDVFGSPGRWKLSGQPDSSSSEPEPTVGKDIVPVGA